MKKVLSFTLVSLALAALSAPAFAKFELSVRGDVGASGSQVPLLWTDLYTTSNDSAAVVIGERTNRDEDIWDFTVRAAWYLGCSPCAPYVAASWQISDHKNTTTSDTLQQAVSGLNTFVPYFYVPNAAVNGVGTDSGFAITPSGLGNSLTAEIGVLNRLSKFKFGFGVDVFKCCKTFALTSEFGLSAVSARLDVSSVYTVGALSTTTLTAPLTTLDFITPSTSTNFTLNTHELQKTEGLGMYAMFKGEYKFPPMCGASCFSVYGKVETTDYYARQTYNYDFNYFDNASTPVSHDYNETTDREYNNVIEVDLEAALVYSPRFSTCWNDFNLSIALGVRTDSYVNLFVHTDNALRGDSILSLARPTFFGELTVKF